MRGRKRTKHLFNLFLSFSSPLFLRVGGGGGRERERVRGGKKRDDISFIVDNFLQKREGEDEGERKEKRGGEERKKPLFLRQNLRLLLLLIALLCFQFLFFLAINKK